MIPPTNWRDQYILENAITESLRADLAAQTQRAADLAARLDGAEAGRDVWKERAERAEAEIVELQARWDRTQMIRWSTVPTRLQWVEGELAAVTAERDALRGEVAVLRNALEKADLFIKRTRSLIETVDRVAEKQGDDEFVWFYNLPSGPWHACLAVARDQAPTDVALTATPRSAKFSTLVAAALPVVEAEKRYRTSKRNGERDEALAQLHECHDRLIAAADAVLTEKGYTE